MLGRSELSNTESKCQNQCQPTALTVLLPPSRNNSTMPPSNLSPIIDAPSHDAAISHASSTCMVIIYVHSPSNPICTRTTPKIENLAEQYSTSSTQNQQAKDLNHQTQSSEKEIRLFSMELTPQTVPMIKFGVQNTPIFICLRESWCETILGADVRRLEGIIRDFVGT